MYLYLSHVLRPTDPVFPGNLGIRIRPQFSIEKGHSFNQIEFEMCNHIGTHMDFPRHFNPSGKTADQITPEELVFNSPILVEVPKNDCELIEPADLSYRVKRMREADLLLLRTGFESFRGDPERYSKSNPALSLSCGKYLLANFPRLRAIGMDFISAGNVNGSQNAVEIHQTLLGYPKAENRYITIIEDMALKDCCSSLEQVIVLPIRIAGADGAPCTVLARCI